MGLCVSRPLCVPVSVPSTPLYIAQINDSYKLLPGGRSLPSAQGSFHPLFCHTCSGTELNKDSKAEGASGKGLIPCKKLPGENQAAEGGAARCASIFSACRAAAAEEGGAFLLLHSGDAFSPCAPLGVVTHGRHMPPVLSAMRFNAACLGNHELDDLLDNAEELMKACSFPWLLSNLKFTRAKQACDLYVRSRCSEERAAVKALKTQIICLEERKASQKDIKKRDLELDTAEKALVEKVGLEQASFLALPAKERKAWEKRAEAEAGGGRQLPGTREFALVTAGAWRVGVLGLIQDDFLGASSCAFLKPDTELEPPLACAQRLSKHLREQEGAHVVVALTHMRRYDDYEFARQAGEAHKPGSPRIVDLVLGGHDHEIEHFGGTSQGDVPVLKSGADFTAVTLVKLCGGESDEEGLRRSRVEPSVIKHLALNGRNDQGFALSPMARSIEPRSIGSSGNHLAFAGYLISVQACIPEDDGIRKLVMDQYEKVFEGSLNRIVGMTAVPLEAREADIRSRETNLGNLLADVMRRASGADVALLNSGTIRGDRTFGSSISSDEKCWGGFLRYSDLMEMCPKYTDVLVKLKVKGRVLKDALTWSVVKQGSGGWLQVSGLKFNYKRLKLPEGTSKLQRWPEGGSCPPEYCDLVTSVKVLKPGLFSSSPSQDLAGGGSHGGFMGASGGSASAGAEEQDGAFSNGGGALLSLGGKTVQRAAWRGYRTSDTTGALSALGLQRVKLLLDGSGAKAGSVILSQLTHPELDDRLVSHWESPEDGFVRALGRDVEKRERRSRLLSKQSKVVEEEEWEDLVLDKDYTVALKEFLVRDGDGYAMFKPSQMVDHEGHPVVSLLSAYFHALAQHANYPEKDHFLAVAPKPFPGQAPTRIFEKA